MSEEFSLEMLEANEVSLGDVVEATVLKNDDDKQFIVSLSGGYQAVLPVREIAEGDDVKVGDAFDVVVKKPIVGNDSENGSFIVSKKALEARKAWDTFAQTHHEGDQVTGEVVSEVRGGLVVNVEGARAFVPASLLSDRFVRNLKQYVGQTLTFVIAEINPAENRLVLNRKELAAKEKVAQLAEILGKLNVDDIVEGTVARITNFGAFIDLGGIDGLVHVSQLSYDHVTRPSDVVEEGQTVKVKILDIDYENGKVSLSIKATEPSPWDKAVTEIATGDILDGTVKRITDFGAFVEVIPGVEGLVHISQVSHDRVEDVNTVLKPGEGVKVQVLNIDSAAKRIALSIKATQEKPVKALTEEEKLAAEIAKREANDAAEIAKAVEAYKEAEEPLNNPFAALKAEIADSTPTAEEELEADEACEALPEL